MARLFALSIASSVPSGGVRQNGFNNPEIPNRVELLLKAVDRTQELPLSVRLSCTDYTEGGWTLDDSVALSKELKTLGVDLVDCSSGGNVSKAKITVGPGYQVPFAEAIRKHTGILTAAVGMITEPVQAEEILTSGKADMVFLARQMLRDPHWSFTAARALKQADKVQVPAQYLRSV